MYEKPLISSTNTEIYEQFSFKNSDKNYKFYI